MTKSQGIVPSKSSVMPARYFLPFVVRYRTTTARCMKSALLWFDTSPRTEGLLMGAKMAFQTDQRLIQPSISTISGGSAASPPPQ
jgi:hypothetical protein